MHETVFRRGVGDPLSEVSNVVFPYGWDLF